MSTSPAPDHNLRTLPWISVRYLDGTRRDLGLDQLFADAHLIRGFAIPGAAERAGIFRFLISVTALIARAHGDVDWDDVAEDGFDPDATRAALDAVSSHLWLIHPDTPFMQDPLIGDQAALQPISTLRPMAPGGSSKTWWGRQGDGFTAAALAPAEAAATLTAAWFYSPAAGGRPPAQSYADGPKVGWKGRGTLRPGTQGVRAFWVGDTLAQTLLANVMDEWVSTDTSLPLWATKGRVAATEGALLTSTWTGTTYRLDYDTDQGVFTGFRNAGRRLPGMEEPDKKAFEDTERDLWRADATVLLEHEPPKDKKNSKPTTATRTIKALDPGTTGMEYLASWWLRHQTTGQGAIAQRRGIVEVDHSEALIVRIEGEATSPELRELSWLNIDHRIRDRRREKVLIELAADFAHLMWATRTAVAQSFDEVVANAVAPRFGYSRANQAFAQHSDQALSDIIHSAERGPITLTESRALSAAVLRAFDETVAPFLTPQTIEKVAMARRTLVHRAYTSPSALRLKEASA